MIGSSKMGFTSKMNWKRMKFHFNLFRKSERNLNDAIYKTIFATITQSRMKGIVFAEIERIENKVGKKF